MKNETKDTVTFRITDDTRKAILEICATKPFNSVFGITKMIDKDVLTDQEANAVINAIGQFPYAEVAGFFAKVPEYFVMISAEVTENTAETVETVETDKTEEALK